VYWIDILLVIAIGFVINLAIGSAIGPETEIAIVYVPKLVDCNYPVSFSSSYELVP
jgi:predicted histidine transporter YuiF (NhaC family)